MRLWPRLSRASGVSVCRETDRRLRRPGRSTKALLFLRLVGDRLWFYFSMRLDPHHEETSRASLRADILSYAFFLALIGATFLL